MKAMDKIRKLCRRNFSSLTQVQLAKMIGVHKSVVSRFWSGERGSMAIAEYMAEKHGYVFVALLSRARRETTAACRKRASRIPRVQTVDYSYPKDHICPSSVVQMAPQKFETHPLIPTTPATSITVAYPVERIA